MRYDDTLETVLAADVSTASGKASAWRQLVDLIGRRRVAADARAMDLLHTIRDAVPATVRAASARALELADPPAPLVNLCALDEIAVAAPVLRHAQLSSGEWIELLPRLSAAARSVLRARRDLPPGVDAALASFGPADFVVAESEAAPGEARVRVRLEPVPVDPVAVEPLAPETVSSTSTFISIGAAAMGIPLVAQALEQADEQGEEQGEAAQPAQSGTEDAVAVSDATAQEPPMEHVVNLGKPEGAGEPAPAGPFEIADVVARIDAFYAVQQDRAATAPPPPQIDGFRFETDEWGVIRWVDGVSRAPLIGLSLDLNSDQGSRADGVAAGALRQRAAFSDARLHIVGESDAGGDWRISATPAFDPATGRFCGYRGTARRPRREEDAAPAVPRTNPAADSLRQLMHELRTPTNAIAGFAEMIEREMLGEAPALYRERAGAIRTHARALLAAIDDLDIAARIEADALPLHDAEIALRPLLTRIADDLAPLAELRGAWLSLPEEDANLRGDPRAMERMVSRLIATMLSAAGQGERVGIAIAPAPGRVVLRVDRPRALGGQDEAALFALDDEREEAALLGTGFALRLVRNIAGELGGTLAVTPDAIAIDLPALVTKSLEQAR